MKSIEYRLTQLKDIRPAEYNPRTMSKKANEGLDASFDNFGYIVPICANKNGTLVSGHQRLRKLLERGVTEAMVGWVDLNPQEEVALNIAMNSPSMRGQYSDKTADLVSELSQKMDLSVFKDLQIEDTLKYALMSDDGEMKEKKKKPEKEESLPAPDDDTTIPKERLGIHCPKCFSVFKYSTKEVIKEGKIPDGN